MNAYHERRESNGEKALLKWILGIVSSLLVAAIIGAWNWSIQFAELRTEVKYLQQQFNEFKARIPARYRGEGTDADRVAGSDQG